MSLSCVVGLKIFRNIELEQGLVSLGRVVFMVKLKNEERTIYLLRFVVCFVLRVI